MSVNSSRRIISRHKITHHKDPKTTSDYKLAKPKQTPRTKEAEVAPVSQLVAPQTINYLNKEPFNVDVTVEES